MGELYEREFRAYHRGGTHSRPWYTINNESLYDFLFDNDYPAWLCNLFKSLPSTPTRYLKELIMRLHTGEAVATATKDWDWLQREKLGQQYLESLAEDVLQRPAPPSYGLVSEDAKRDALVTKLERALGLDGYELHNGTLLRPEEDVLDTAEESGVLHSLYDELGLPERETAFHHLQLSEDHCVAGRWDDCIGNSRKFLECVLREVASTFSTRKRNTPLSQRTYDHPAAVRDYLEREELLESKEKEALAKVYGLLSETGSHPYMARDDQAHLLRHLALTLAQFVMLRLRGAISHQAS